MFQQRPFRNIFAELGTPLYNSNEIRKLLTQCTQEFNAETDEGKIYHADIKVLLQSLADFYHSTSQTPMFRAFRETKSEEELQAILDSATNVIAEKLQRLKQISKHTPAHAVLSDAIHYCAQSMKSRLNETKGEKIYAIANRPKSASS